LRRHGVIVDPVPNYRRALIPGGCWFFTVNLLDRRRRLLTDHIDPLREATRRTQMRHPFSIDAMVVLPDHIHARFGRCRRVTPIFHCAGA
jgi:putative transposase